MMVTNLISMFDKFFSDNALVPVYIAIEFNDYARKFTLSNDLLHQKDSRFTLKLLFESNCAINYEKSIAGL